MNPCKWTIAFVALFALCVGAGIAEGQPQRRGDHGDVSEQSKQPAVPKCPVMGDPVDFSVKVDTEAGPVFFCCNGCIKKYQEQPEKYARGVAEQRKAVAAMPKVQVTCPVSGRTIDKKVSIDHGGQKVCFCCSDCVSKFKKNPAKYEAALANSYTYQTKCPVMGGDVDPAAFSTLPDGRKVFYCCPGCDRPFLKDPARYAPKLAAQGMKIDPDKILAGEKKAHDKRDDHESHGHDHHEHGD